MTQQERKTITQAFNEVYLLELSGYKTYEQTSFYGLRKTKLAHSRNGNIAEVVTIPSRGNIRIFVNNKIVKETCIPL